MSTMTVAGSRNAAFHTEKVNSGASWLRWMKEHYLEYSRWMKEHYLEYSAYYEAAVALRRGNSRAAAQIMKEAYDYTKQNGR